MDANVLLFGSANTEEIIVLDRPFVEGAKLQYKEHTTGVGGSAVNWSFWLRAAGASPIAFCPFGHDHDDDWKRISAALDGIGIPYNPGGYETADEAQGNSPKETTRRSYIIVLGNERRTVLSRGGTTGWLRDISARARSWLQSDSGASVRAVMIGNIPSDQSDLASTRGVLGAIRESGRDVVVYANMGRAQLTANFERYWNPCLPGIDVFQFGQQEAKTFVRNATGSEPNLPQVFERFAEWRINAIVTLGRGAAVSVFPRAVPSDDLLFFTWPPPLVKDEEFKDPTGSGDAFGAGFVAAVLKLRRQNCIWPFNPAQLCMALDTGGKFASIACQGYGGLGAYETHARNMQDWVAPSQTPANTTCSRRRGDISCALYALDRP